jgi:hypothetical protein
LHKSKYVAPGQAAPYMSSVAVPNEDITQFSRRKSFGMDNDNTFLKDEELRYL